MSVSVVVPVSDPVLVIVAASASPTSTPVFGRWPIFLGTSLGLLVAVLLLARASSRVLHDGSVEAGGGRTRDAPDRSGSTDDGWVHHADREASTEGEPTGGTPTIGPTWLLINVTLTHGLLALLLLAAAWYVAVPARAFGIEPGTLDLAELALGAVLGVGLFIAADAGAHVADRVGFERDETVRSMLAPASPAGWALLLLLALPTVAIFEELLFRAALVGVASVGLGVSPWPLALLSSVAFAFAHGAQGTTGIVVTGALGVVLAVAFVLTGSLLVVVVAHYVVNALEFAVHEGPLAPFGRRPEAVT